MLCTNWRSLSQLVFIDDLYSLWRITIHLLHTHVITFDKLLVGIIRQNGDKSSAAQSFYMFRCKKYLVHLDFCNKEGFALNVELDLQIMVHWNCPLTLQHGIDRISSAVILPKICFYITVSSTLLVYYVERVSYESLSGSSV